MTEANLEPPRDLLEAARAALGHAYAPYSNFPVAAAVRFRESQVPFAAINCENASFGLTMCAERAAVFFGVSQGCRNLQECLILTPTKSITTPCGACRQVLREFGAPTTTVVWSVSNGGVQRWMLEALLPESFGPEDLT